MSSSRESMLPTLIAVLAIVSLALLLLAMLSRLELGSLLP